MEVVQVAHVIGPDIVTSASLFAAAAHPGRFLSLVVGTGGAAVPLQLGEPLREWVFAPDLDPYRRLGGRTIVERVIQTLERYLVSNVARDDCLASFEGDRFAESRCAANSHRSSRYRPARLSSVSRFAAASRTCTSNNDGDVRRLISCKQRAESRRHVRR
jgi:hypothetical protein